MTHPLVYRIVMDSGNRIVSGPMRLDDAARTIAALYEEGHENIHALVGPDRRPATRAEQQRLVRKATIYAGEAP